MMYIHEVLDVLSGLQSSFAEIRELSRIFLNKMPDHEGAQDSVYELLDSNDPKAKIQAICAILFQKTWKVPHSIVEKLGELALDSTNTYIRGYAIEALARLNAPKSFITKGLVFALECHERNDIVLFSDYVDNDLFSECYETIIDLYKQGFIEKDLFFSIFEKCEKWNPYIEKQFLEYLDGIEYLIDLSMVDMVFNVKMSDKKLLKFIDLFILHTNDVATLRCITENAGRRSLLQRVFRAVLHKVDSSKDRIVDYFGESVRDDDLLYFGEAISPFLPQIEAQILPLWDNADTSARIIILSILLNYRGKIRDLSKAQKIVEDSLSCPNNTVFLLGVAIHNYYGLATPYPNVAPRLQDCEDDSLSRLIFYIIKSETNKLAKMSKDFGELLANNNYDEPCDILQMLSVLRRFHNKCILHIDKVITNSLSTNPERQDYQKYLRAKKLSRELQQSIEHTTEMLRSLFDYQDTEIRNAVVAQGS